MGKKTHTLQVRVSDELAQRIDSVLEAEAEVQARFPQLFIDRSFNRATLMRLALDLGLRQLQGESALGGPPSASQEAVAWLYPEEGKGSVIPLALGNHRIGRDPAQAEVIIADKRVSRLHSAIFIESRKEIAIRDLTESRRTFVNGRPVDEEVALRPGDVIGFTSSVIYRLVTKPSARPTRDELASPVVRAIRDFATETLDGARHSRLDVSELMVGPHTSAMREFLDALDRIKPALARAQTMESELRGEAKAAYQAALSLLARVTSVDDEALDDDHALDLASRLDEVGGRLHDALGKRKR